MEWLYKIFGKGNKVMSTICTSECVNCIHGTLDNSNKSKVKIICAVKEREYYYGQRINCEDYKIEEKKE